jgi:hypothetical protein
MKAPKFNYTASGQNMSFSLGQKISILAREQYKRQGCVALHQGGHNPD